MTDAKKPTILICSDSAVIHTGLARVVRSVFRKLYATGKYNIIQHGWNHIASEEKVPWDIVKTYEKDGQIMQTDQFGQQSFASVVDHYKPELVWAFHDPWNMKHLVDGPTRHRYNMMGYLCIDSAPISRKWKSIIEAMDDVVVFGEWPKDLVVRDPYLTIADDRLHLVPHGVDTNVFKPISDKEGIDKKRLELLKANKGDIVVGCIGRNQPRKNIGRFFQLAWHIKHGAWSQCGACDKVTPAKYDPADPSIWEHGSECTHCGSENITHAEPNPCIKFYYHGSPLDPVGWDVPELHDRFKLTDTLYFNKGLKPLVGLCDEDMNVVYNMMDIFCLPTRCEGFGLPILEAMSAGVPVVVPNYSAYTDWATAGAEYVEGEMYIDPMLDCHRIEVYMHDMIEKVYRLSEEPDRRAHLGKGGRQVALTMDWDLITKDWEVLLDKVLDRGIKAKGGGLSIVSV